MHRVTVRQLESIRAESVSPQTAPFVRTRLYSLVTFFMAVLCVLHPSPWLVAVNSLRLLKVWALPWPPGTLEHLCHLFVFSIRHRQAQARAAVWLLLLPHPQAQLTSTSWMSCCQSAVLFFFFPAASARGKARVWALSGAKLCMLDGQHHTLSGAREGPSLYPDLVTAGVWGGEGAGMKLHMAQTIVGGKKASF